MAVVKPTWVDKPASLLKNTMWLEASELLFCGFDLTVIRFQGYKTFSFQLRDKRNGGNRVVDPITTFPQARLHATTLQKAKQQALVKAFSLLSKELTEISKASLALLN